jgi:hypothetical protein
MAAFTVTTNTNTITISEGDISLKNTNMPILDGNYSTTQWIEDIYFKLYLRSGSTPGTYAFAPVNWQTLTSHDIGMVLATLFPNLYNNPNAGTLQTEYPEFTPLFARLNGSPLGSGSAYNFANTFDQTAFGTPADTNNTTTCILTQFGIGNLLDDHIPVGGAAAGSYGIHITAIDPTNPAVRNTSFYTGTNAAVSVQYIVHSNLLSTAFSTYGENQGGIQPFQFLAMWIPISRLLKTLEPTKNPVLYLNTLLDTMWLRRGLTNYFNRSARLDNTYGATGNYLLSIFNFNPSAPSGESWSVPVFPLFSSLFEHEIVNKDIYVKLPLGVASAIDVALGIQYNAGVTVASGPIYTLTGNIAANNKKVYRRLIMLYTACAEYDLDNPGGLGQAFIDATETLIVAQTGLTLSQFYQSGASLLSSGEYAYFFKFTSEVAFTPTGGSATTIFGHFVNPYISWGANVLALVDTFNFKRNFTTAQTALYTNCPVLDTAINAALTAFNIPNMNAGQQAQIIAYQYTP